MCAAQTQEGVRSQSPLCAGEETKNQMNWRNKPDLLLSSWSVGHDMDTNLPQVPVGMDAHSSHGNRLFQFHRGNLRIETRLPPSLPCRPDCSLPSNSPWGHWDQWSVAEVKKDPISTFALSVKRTFQPGLQLLCRADQEHSSPWMGEGGSKSRTAIPRSHQ